MIKRMIYMLVALGIVLGLLFAYQAYKNRAQQQRLAAAGSPTQTVSAMAAAYLDWQPQIRTVGNISAVNGVNVSPQVTGLVTAIHFEQGQDVNAGDLLLQLYADDEIATLDSLKSAAVLAETTLERDQRQFKVKGVSQQTLDADAAALAEARANVAAQQAVVDMKTIRAPFAGRLGIRQVDLGQYLEAGATIVSLQSLDPVYLDFSIPQARLAEIGPGQAVTARSDAFPAESFSGTIEVINPDVDPDTLNVLVRAQLQNPQHKLLPGMFVTLAIDTGEPVSYLTLPQTAIASNPYGDIVYLVEPGAAGDEKHMTARQVLVTTGPTRGDQVAVLSGIKQGDMIVTAGQIKLRNGTPVTIDNTVQPGFSPNPSPKDQ